MSQFTVENIGKITGRALATLVWIAVISIGAYFVYNRFAGRFGWPHLGYDDINIILLSARILSIFLTENQSQP